VVLIVGDVSVDGLGLSQIDRSMLIDKVDIVLHCAANVKFVVGFKEIINANTHGTFRMLQLALEMKRLKAFTYMSTAFCQSYQMILEEKYYPTNLGAFTLMDKIQDLSDESLNVLERKL